MKTISVILALYITLRGIIPEKRLPIWLKLILFGMVCLVSFKFQIIQYVYGHMFLTPNLPIWGQLLIAWLYAAIFFLFFCLILTDIYLIVNVIQKWITGHPLPTRQCRPLALCLSLLLATIGIWQGVSMPKIKHVSIAIPNLPQEANGMKIAFLTDLHIDGMTFPNRLKNIVQAVSEEKPDLILFGGDNMDGKVEDLIHHFEPIRSLKAPLGIYGVPGNHEYYSGYQSWIEALTNLGIIHLENERVLLSNGVLLIGLTDEAARRFNQEPPNMMLVNNNHHHPTILLSHRPNAFVYSNADLQLSGHTHGGLLWGLNYIIAHANQGYVSGLYQEGSSQLYISNGTGMWSGFPIRLGIPSEITIITLFPAGKP